MKIYTRYLKQSSLVLLSLLLAFACTSKKSDETASDGEEVEMVSVLLIGEDHINNKPLKKKKSTSAVSESTDATDEAAAEAAQEEVAEAVEGLEEVEAVEDYLTMEDVEAALYEQEMEMMSEVTVTEAVIPLDETQTIAAFTEKGKEKGTVQVVSDLQTGEIDHIAFTHKNHKDVYDISAGMTAHEAKKLRKELKHMVKDGNVFLYDDQSNIMYLLDAQDMAGDEITEADVDTMEIQAVIWKDKKHHKQG